MHTPEFSQIIESSLDELLSFIEPWEFTGKSLPEDLFYAKTIIHFHRGHFEELRSNIRICNERGFCNPLQLAIGLRLAIRLREIDLDLVNKAMSVISDDEKWKGELSILIATSMAILNRHEEARLWFLKSSFALEQSGSLRKAVRARSNALIAETHLDSSRHRIPEYMDLYRRAKSVGESAVASTCFLNISREYQVMGSHLAALKYVNEALEISELSFGALHNHLCLVHRAHVLFCLNRMTECRLDIELLAATPFPEVIAAVELLKDRLMGRENTGHAHLLSTWREQSRFSSELKLSDLETDLIQFLSVGPKSRHEIIEHIYGERLDLDVRINRFKSLIGNLRKKSPDLIVNENGHYRLADRVVQPRKQRA